MAKIPLQFIGSGLQPSLISSSSELRQLDEQLAKEKARLREGWGKTYQERVQQKGKMTTWERLEALKDKDSVLFPLGTFVNDGLLFGEGKEQRSSPSAGVITVLMYIHRRIVMVIANDNTVASGSWWPQTPEKIIRAQEIALKLSLPVVYLVDCSGLFLPEQSRSFPGQKGAGHIFKMNALLSSRGIPQIAGVMGDCIAGGGYMPIISDKVYMTEQAYMVIAGAALIQGAKSLQLSSLDIGGAPIHVHASNCADVQVPDDATCLLAIRKEISSLASSAADYYRNGVAAAEPHFPPEEILDILPSLPRHSYDIRQIIARLVDNGLFWELQAQIGQEVVVGVGRINGLYVGIAANVQELTLHPLHPTQKRPGGILYKEGVAKLSAFSRSCNDDGIPIIWLQDVSGFDVGIEAEKQGLLGYGSSLIYSNSTNTTPMITLLLRKASGAGYYAMAGLPYEPVVQLATPLTRLAVMEGRTLAIGAYNSKLDDNFQIITQDPVEKENIEKGMEKVAARIEKDMNPYKAALQMDVDELIGLSELRPYLCCFVEACYQSQGTRRIKNPRIWSLHDWPSGTAYAAPAVLPKEEKSKAGKATSHKKVSLQANESPLLSPMDGLFYRSKTPQEPPFVKEGDILKKGDTIGLIEVMKCFYPVVYEEEQTKTIKSFEVKDNSPIQSGEIIAIMKR